MEQTLRYIIDNSGNKTSVIVPYNKWKKLNENYQKLLNKNKSLTGIKDGLLEVKLAKSKGKELESLTNFLNDCKS